MLGGLALSGLGAAGLAAAPSGLGPLDELSSPAGAAAGALGLAMLCAAAGVFVARPAWVPLAVLATAPLRPPIAFESGGGFPLSIAEDGQLGRLLPLYLVLAAAGLALAWRAGRRRTGRRARAAARGGLPRGGVHRLRLPIAHVGRRAGVRRRAAAVLHRALRRAGGGGGPRAVPGLGARRARADRHRAGGRLRGGGPVPGRHARAVLLRPQPGRVQRQLGLLPRHVPVRRPQPLRAARGAWPGPDAGGAGRFAGWSFAWGSRCWYCCGPGCSCRTRSRAWPP